MWLRLCFENILCFHYCHTWSLMGSHVSIDGRLHFLSVARKSLLLHILFNLLFLHMLICVSLTAETTNSTLSRRPRLGSNFLRFFPLPLLSATSCVCICVCRVTLSVARCAVPHNSLHKFFMRSSPALLHVPCLSTRGGRVRLANFAANVSVISLFLWLHN